MRSITRSASSATSATGPAASTRSHGCKGTRGVGKHGPRQARDRRQEVIADNRQTILEVARDNGIHSIPTLCHDKQLEPFASCFLCVVKVKGRGRCCPPARRRSAAGCGGDRQRGDPEIAQGGAGTDALEPLRRLHRSMPARLPCRNDIQGYVALAALGKYQDAIQLIKERNPLPAICGRVCTRPCEVRGCRRNLLDEAVGIDYIKRYLADLDLGRREGFRPLAAPKNGRRVAVVGAGPAGLSCAYYLALKGYDAQIFESLPEAGGMLRYGIPEYRLPKDILDLEVNLILDPRREALHQRHARQGLHGLEPQGRRLRGDLPGIGSMGQLEDEGSGGGSRRRLARNRVPQELLAQEEARHPRQGPRRRGGNTAIDCARTALRLGAMEVRLLYRRTRTEMPANEMEIVEAEHEGVEMDFLVAPVKVVQPKRPPHRSRVHPDGARRARREWTAESEAGPGLRVRDRLRLRDRGDRPGDQDHRARRWKVPNFLPLGEVFEPHPLADDSGHDKTFETSVEGVFSGGDVVTGARRRSRRSRPAEGRPFDRHVHPHGQGATRTGRVLQP